MRLSLWQRLASVFTLSSRVLGTLALVSSLERSGRAAGEVVDVYKTIVPKAPECAALFPKSSTSTKPNLWESAKQPALRSHCLALQNGVKLYRQGNFKGALDDAKKADDLTPGHAGPWVVRGSAWARWGKATDAVAAFDKALALHPRALDDAETLDDYGAVLVRVGRIEDARKAYRALMPRVTGPQGLCGLQPQCEAAGLAYLTAGVLAMEGGPTSLDEAIAILRESRARADTKLEIRRIATLALALALDRHGEPDAARELTTEIVKTRGVPSEVPAEVGARFVAMEEGMAMRAIGLEAAEPTAALEVWRAYLAAGGDKRAWGAHAKEHIARLEKGDKGDKGEKAKADPKAKAKPK